MSKNCPFCSAELDDAAVVCDSCGKELTEEVVEETAAGVVEEPAVDAAVDAVEEADAVEDTVVDAVEEADDAVAAAEEDAAASFEGAETSADPFDVPKPVPEIGIPEQEKPEKKGNKEMVLGICLVVTAVLLVAAIVFGAVTMIPKLAPKSAAQSTIESYINSDFKTYYAHDYYTVFMEGDVDGRVEAAQEYAEDFKEYMKNMKAEVIEVVSLSSDAVNSIKNQLTDTGYSDVDKVEDIKIVILQMTNTEEDDEGKTTDQVSIGTLYALKVSGDWYFTSSF